MESGISSALEFGITILILTVFTVLSLSILVAFIYALSELKSMISAYKSKKNKVYSESVISKNTDITELMLLDNIDKGIFDETLVGKSVELNEDDHTHEWVIIRVNEDSYDLWYNGNIAGSKRSLNEDTCILWANIFTSGNTVRDLWTYYKSKLSSSIQAKLKPGLNVNCGDDLVVVLSAKQLGCTENDISNDDNSPIPYFNSDSRRSIGTYYWTSSTISYNPNFLWSVTSDGTFNNNYYFYHYSVVPAIRIGI